MYYLDLFSGIGGFALGAYWAGWKFDGHFFSEVDAYCNGLYLLRFPEAKTLGDISQIDVSLLPKDSPWVITGGFPCQDISIAGKGEGISGERSGLWFEMWRIIRDLRPRWVIAENVGAITFRGLSTVLNSLAEIGYDAEWQGLRSCQFRLPHQRRRMWIVAYPNSTFRPDGILQKGCSSLYEKRKESFGGCYWGKPKMESSPIEILQRWEGVSICKSALVRVDDGIPNVVERLDPLGNSIVPQIAELLFRRIAEIDENK